jgi:hypothetical protein
MTITSDGRPAREGARTDAVSLRDYRPGLFHLRDTWLPLAHGQRVRRRVVRRAMHGEPVFFWRDRGRLRATSATPAERERGSHRPNAFTGTDGNYPLVERYGYAWVWYGDPASASPELLPNVPHLPLDGLPLHMQGNVVFDCSYELVCENLLDFTHADFLHSALAGDPLAEDDEVEVSSTSETVTVTRRARARQVPPLQRPFVKAKKQDLDYVTVTHVRSGVNIIHVHWQPFASVRMVHPANPESATRCRTVVTFNVVDSVPILRHLFPFCAHMVGTQDNFALRPQNPRYVLGDGGKDLNSRFDRAGLRFRKVYQDLVSRQLQGDTSYLDDGHPSRDIRAELHL